MQIFDTHCHYNLDPFYTDWEQHWQKAQATGVTHSTIVGVDIETSKKAIQLSDEDKNFYPIIGCHPGYYQEFIESGKSENEALQLIEEDKKALFEIATSRVVAVGETGLDYFRLPENNSAAVIKNVQQLAFKAHLNFATEKNLPIIIHAREKSEEAYKDILRILKEVNFTQKFVLHCVSGPSAYVQEAVGMGAFIGLAGNLTYKNSEHLRELAAFTPPNRLLLETDAPFLPPVPFRGKPCEPWMISETARYLENELSLDIAQIYQNSFEIFQIT